MMLLGQFSIQAFHSIENYLYDAIRRGTIGTIAFQEARTYLHACHVQVVPQT